MNLWVERMSAGAFFPMKGFLGTGAPFGADLNLVVQLIMGVALIAGALLAKQKRVHPWPWMCGGPSCTAADSRFRSRKPGPPSINASRRDLRR